MEATASARSRGTNMDVYFVSFIDDTLKIYIDDQEWSANLTDASFNDEGYIQFWFEEIFELRFFPSEELLYFKFIHEPFWSKAKDKIYNSPKKVIKYNLPSWW